MPLSPQEELELLQLEEEEYQASQASGQPALMGSPEVGKALQQGPDQSTINAALAGAAQGSTFGFSDEIGAGVDVAGEAGKELLSGKVPDMVGLPAKWREYQKSREAANKALSEESPYAYLGGEAAGGVGSAMLMPSLGAARVATGAAKLSPKLGSFLAGQSGGAMSRVAGKGSAMALEGAPLGALYGAGSSEADLSKPSELAMDTASGAAMGSIGGLAIGGGSAAIGEGIDAAKGYAKSRDFGRKLGEAYEFGKEGVSFSTTEGQDKIAKLVRDYPDQFVNQIMKVDDQIGKEVGAAIDQAQKAGVVINIEPQVAEATDQLVRSYMIENPALLGILDPKSKQAISIMNSKGLGQLTPVEARGVKDALYDVIDKMQGLTGDQSVLARQQASKLAASIDDALKNTPGMEPYRAAAEKFTKFRSMIPETVLEPGVPLDKRTKYMGNLKNMESSLLKSSKSLLGDAQLSGDSVTSGPRTGLIELKDNLQTLGQQYPDIIQGLGSATPDEAFGKIRGIADKMATLKQGQGVNPNQGAQKTITGTVVGSGEGLVLGGANIAGSAAGSTPVKTAKAVYNAGNDSMLALANKMKSGQTGVPGGEEIGAALEKAIMNKDDVAKNALLFKLLQVPQYREMLKSEGAE